MLVPMELRPVMLRRSGRARESSERESHQVSLRRFAASGKSGAAVSEWAKSRRYSTVMSGAGKADLRHRGGGSRNGNGVAIVTHSAQMLCQMVVIDSGQKVILTASLAVCRMLPTPGLSGGGQR